MTSDGGGFRHTVLLRWREGTTEADQERVAEGLAVLAAALPVVRAMTFGRDAGVAEGNFDLGVVVEFASAEDYLVYAASEQHRRFVTEQVAPILAERAAVQYVVRGATSS